MLKNIALLFALGVIAIFSPAAFAGHAKEISVSLTFAAPDFTQNGSGQFVPHIDNLLNTVEAGLPGVPVKTLTLAIPAGFAFKKASLEEGQHNHYAVEIARVAALPPSSWQTNPPANLHEVPAPAIEGEQYPNARFEVSEQIFHGVRVAVVDVYPLVVGKDFKSSDFISSARLKLELRPLGLRNPTSPLLTHQRKEVEDAVDNPEVITSYGIRSLGNAKAGYDYLILSTKDLIAFEGENSLKDLQAGLNKRGLSSKIFDVEAVESSSSGQDAPEKIRNFIKGEYQSSGIQYVLLAGRARNDGTGSSDFIPARPLWSKIRAYMEGHWTTDEEQIASDMYYACLDGSYNGNGNDKWGEPTDGDTGGDVDFMCEVTVGRAALESTSDLQNFVRKTLWAYDHPIPKKALLLGELLFPELSIYGDDYMKQLVGQSTDHGFTTKGYTPDWQIDTLYDRDHKWSGDEALDKINAGGYGMVNHLGHSNQSYNMRLSAFGALPDFQNATPFIYYSQGCLAGQFTSGSFIDKMVSNANAAVVAVGNSSYGLSPEDPDPSTTKTPGASQMLHRQFINAFFGTGDKTAGKAHQDSKKALNGLKSAQEIRWVDWSATYFGDPSLPTGF